MDDARAFLERLFWTAVKAAHPDTCLPAHLPEPPPPPGRLVILAAGKAAGSMAEAAERHYLDTLGLDPNRIEGIAVARHGYGRPTRRVAMVEAGHPVPDAAGLAGAERAIALAQGAGLDDLVLALVSGGASANWIAPAAGVTLADKQALTRALLRSGATIDEINTVRKHLSRIKGGRLAALASPAPVVTLAISDVPNDDPSVIGSGPTVPDPSTLADAKAVLRKYQVVTPASVDQVLANPTNESPKPDHPAFSRAVWRLVARPRDGFTAVERLVAEAGFACIFLGDQLEGEAREVAREHAVRAKALLAEGRRAIILSGGELTVTMRGNGRGGPNQEYALALVEAFAGTPGLSALSADTDGTDGGGGSADDPAGAFVDQAAIHRARQRGLDPAVFLAENDSTTFFAEVGSLLATGPTWTNINDFRAIMVEGR